MTCAESPRVQAYFDGELDAIAASEIERHIDQCAECRAELAELGRVRSAIRAELAYVRAPPGLRDRITQALDREAGATTRVRVDHPTWRTRPFWWGAFGGIAGTAAAATIAFLLLSPTVMNPLIDDVVDAHVRSLMPLHLIDVVSTDQHTVKPWFAGHTDVSPVVADFAPEGYRLIGGRADYLDRQRSAVVVYQHGPHVINVFSWVGRGRTLPNDTTRNGYHMAFWRAGDLEYCAVSDTGWNELQTLVRLLQRSSAGDPAQ